MIKRQTNVTSIDVKYIYIYYIMFKDLDSLTWFKEIKKA